jgi:hypothetical protein
VGHLGAKEKVAGTKVLKPSGHMKRLIHGHLYLFATGMTVAKRHGNSS